MQEKCLIKLYISFNNIINTNNIVTDAYFNSIIDFTQLKKNY